MTSEECFAEAEKQLRRIDSAILDMRYSLVLAAEAWTKLGRARAWAEWETADA